MKRLYRLRLVRIRFSICLFLMGWSSLGAKCIPTNSVLVPQELIACDGEDCPEGSLEVVVPCENPAQAELVVKDYYYEIRCGCLEASTEEETDTGRKCTVAVGTTIIWSFEGSEAHNVQSSEFDGSSDQAFGSFETYMDSPGEYAYYCSLHRGEMSGYFITVIPTPE